MVNPGQTASFLLNEADTPFLTSTDAYTVSV